MTDTRSDALDRTKVIKGLRLQREFFVRAMRSLQAFNGFDPQIGDPSQIPDLRLLDAIGFEALILDASQPPFRVNGSSARFQAKVAAPGAGNNCNWYMGVRFPSVGQGAFYGALVIDAIHYEGASDLTYGLSTLTNPGAAASPPSVEEPPLRVGQANFKISQPALKGDLVANAGSNIPFIDGTDWAVEGFVGGTPAAGPGWTEPIGDIVVWPGCIFLAQMDTSNVAGRLAIRGRYFSFGSTSTGQLQT